MKAETSVMEQNKAYVACSLTALVQCIIVAVNSFVNSIEVSNWLSIEI